MNEGVQKKREGLSLHALSHRRRPNHLHPLSFVNENESARSALLLNPKERGRRNQFVSGTGARGQGHLNGDLQLGPDLGHETDLVKRSGNERKNTDIPSKQRAESEKRRKVRVFL